ncbi:MAG: hypothetical protein ACIAQF_11235 [Phycisphaerales bacterium JB065]
MLRHRVIHSVRAIAAFGLCALVVASGCSHRAGGFKDDLDEARYERDQLEIELRRVTAERNELRGKLDELTAKLEAVDGVPAAVVIDSMPRCAGIRIDRLSGLYDRDGEPGFEGIDVYLIPIDARDRFVQISGTLSVVATLYPPPGLGDQERVLARRTVKPSEIREAYRSTLLSTHYSVSLELDRPLEATEGTLVLLVQFRDVLTGQTHSAEKILKF